MTAPLNALPLAGLIKLSPIASVITDPRVPDNPIIACNAAFTELTGYQEAEILGRNCRFLAGPQTEPWLSERITKCVIQRKPVFVEILNYKKDGTPFRNALVVAPVFDDEGELAYFLGSQLELEPDDPGKNNSRQLAAGRVVAHLSERQRQVLVRMARGLMNKQIAN
jgi:PAS domain S-box-containing protein